MKWMSPAFWILNTRGGQCEKLAVLHNYMMLHTMHAIGALKDAPRDWCRTAHTSRDRRFEFELPSTSVVGMAIITVKLCCSSYLLTVVAAAALAGGVVVVLVFVPKLSLSFLLLHWCCLD